MITYSAIASSWPKTLQIVTPFGTAVVEVKTSRHRLQQAKARRGRESRPPDMTDYNLRLGGSGATCVTSDSSSRIEVSNGVFILARIRGATEAAKWPRN